ncbi:hypothetical protein [Streptomyces sp. NPDC012510]|uniref:hypothetical protein n=1 Tax=Streptomyces sp. NPDC012510 TaxID=3364838 RepID=UPI0036E49EC8
MDEPHRRLIRSGLDALDADFGYALAGGYAVQAHQIVNQVSGDIDLFARPSSEPGHLRSAQENHLWDESS